MHYVHFFNEEVTNNKKRKQPTSFKLLQTRVKTSDFKQYINGISIIKRKNTFYYNNNTFDSCFKVADDCRVMNMSKN